MTYVPENLAELWLGDLSLMGETIDDSGAVFTIEALDEDATWDNPVPVDVAVQRWMTDGAVASTQGYENRSPSFKVRVSAGTSADLAAGEAALAKRAGKPTTLTWVPPEGRPDAPTTVFEVWTWHLEHTFDGLGERRLERMYTVAMTAKPWSRSENPTVAAAPSVGGVTPVTVSIDTCTSTTNWTSYPIGALSTSGGAVRVTNGFSGPEPRLFKLTRTASVTGLAALPYLVIDVSTSGGLLDWLTVKVGGVTLSKVAASGTVGYYRLPAGTTSFTTLEVAANLYSTSKGATGTYQLSVADVSATDTIGGIGSRKQLTRHLDVGGSVKTSGSIHIASPSATALGTCLIYTTPDTGTGFSSAMRPYRATGNTVTPDATCVSGNHEAFVNAGAGAGGINYILPARTPEGTYVVVGRFLFGSAATMTVFFTSAVGTVSGNFSATVTAAAGVPVWAVLGVIPAPWVSLPPESNVVPQFQVSGTANTGTHTLDELYLFDITPGRGALTLMQSNPGTHLWIDAPDADTVRNRPALYIGSQADRSDAFTPVHTTILSLGDHDLDPDGVTLFTVTDGVDSAAVTASFYRRWHTHAGD